MTDDRYGLLNPVQLATTFRSLPRRYRAAVAGLLLDPDRAARDTRERAVEFVADTVRTLALLDRAVEVTLVTDAPVVVAATVDPTARHWPPASPEDLAPLLDELTDVATALADRTEHAPLDDWDRTATVAGGGGTRRALDLAREAARTGAENLRHLERLVERPA